MKIINSSVKIIKPTGYSMNDIMNSIELAARVSHASIGTRYFRVKDEDFANILKQDNKVLVLKGPFFDPYYYVSIPNSIVSKYSELLNCEEDKSYKDSPYYQNLTAESFCNTLKSDGHLSCFEFGNVYLKCNNDDLDKYEKNKFSKYYKDDTGVYVSTNMRVIVENEWEEDLNYLCDPTDKHDERITVEFICSRAIANELVRHRSLSFNQESQRYCMYNKDKFCGEIKFIFPTWAETNSKAFNSFVNYLVSCENMYFELLGRGLKAEFARDALVNETATRIFVCGHKSDWDHFFELRCSQKAHPDMKKLADILKLKWNTTYISPNIVSN